MLLPIAVQIGHVLLNKYSFIFEHTNPEFLNDMWIFR